MEKWFYFFKKVFSDGCDYQKCFTCSNFKAVILQSAPYRWWNSQSAPYRWNLFAMYFFTFPCKFSRKKKSICSLFFFSKEKSLQFVFLSEIERFNVCMDGGIIESINERKRLNSCYKNLHSVNHLWCAWNLTEKKRAHTHIGKNYVDLCATLMHSGALK